MRSRFLLRPLTIIVMNWFLNRLRTRRMSAANTPVAAGWNPLTLVAMASLWMATVANWPLWRALAQLPQSGSLRGVLFIAGFAATVACLTGLVLVLMAWPRLVKTVISVFVVVAAVAAHFMGSYGVVIDPSMIVNVLQTNPRETRDLLDAQLLLSVLLLAALPLVWLWRAPVQCLPATRQLGRNALALVVLCFALVALVVASFADLSSTMRNHRSMRYLINPLNSFYGLAVVVVEANARPKGPLSVIGADAMPVRSAGSKPPLLLLVVGETARADHFSLNGYARPTNPELAKLDVLSFRDVSSCGTNTAASLPCMFSHLGKRGFEGRDRDHENLLDVLQRAGLAVLWLDNQSSCKGLCDRVPNAYAATPARAEKPLPAGMCSDGECLDGALLHDLDARLQALPEARRTQGVVIVMHQMGSHGPAYFKRAPADRKPFMPECTDTALQQCERAAVVNAYDNSIAYTDHVLAGAIGWLKSTSAAHEPRLLYVSDHGESLGENNIYLHGLPHAVAPPAQTHVPMIYWQPDTASPAAGCLVGLRDMPLTHDSLFHTVLGIVGVTAAEYRRPLDALATCRHP